MSHDDSEFAAIPNEFKAELPLSRRRFLTLAGVGALLAFAAPQLALAQTLQAPSGKAAAIPPRPDRKPRPPRILVLDAGHGGRDPGAIGRRGTEEKDVVLDITQRLAEALQRSKNVRVRLTRSRDEFISLRERVVRAQEARADLFISLHADSAPSRTARGLSAYTLAEKASDDFAKAIAKQENLADLIGGAKIEDTDENVAAILMDLAARHTKNASLKAKNMIVNGVDGSWPILENPMRSANFAVLRAPDVPSLLIETGFLSNAEDEALLRQAARRQRIAQLLAAEIETVLSSAPFV